MTRPGRARTGAGFTLIEVLIALSLLSMLIVLLTAALRASGQVETRVDERFERADQLRTSTQFLREILSSASLRPPAGSLGGAGPMFMARGDQLEWIGVLPAGYGTGGRHFMRLAIEPAGGTSALVLRYAPWADRNAFPDWSGVTSQVLVPQASGLSFSYYNEATNEWSPDWVPRKTPESSFLPSAVEVKLIGTTLPWPLLIARMNSLAISDGSMGSFVIGGSR